MLTFALKNMATKKAQVILIVLSVVISAGVAVLAYNTAEQVNDGISSTAGYYSAIIGPAGSKTQLAMNTMYFTDEPLGTVPYALISQLEQDMRVKQVIPFAMADSYNGYGCVGTESGFLEGKNVREGRMFDDGGCFDVVVGSTVAKVCSLSVGEEIYTSHSAGEEHRTPLKVVGILEKTGTVYDNEVFTQLKTIWEVHEEGEEDHEEHDHEELHGMVCAILVKTLNPTYAMTLVNDYDGKVYTVPGGDSYSLQAIEPMDTVRSVLNDANTTKYIVYVLCGIILVMNIMIISIITLLNMIHSAKEIALMRLIGISVRKINRLYVIQNCFIGLASIILAFGVSRLCLYFMGDYVSSMGVVLNLSRVYPAELLILLSVFIITVIPTVFCTLSLAKKDGIQ